MPATWRSLDEVPAGGGPSALTIGNFDGVHVGHVRIFAEVLEIARRAGWRSMALTFDPHPTRVVAPERAPRLLTTTEARLVLMEQTGLEAALVLPFTPAVARLEPEEFVRSIVVGTLGARAVVVGANFRFGRGQSGNVDALQDYGRRLGFEVRVVEPVFCRGELVSSSRIRRLITAGQVARARPLLGRPYAVEGKVVRGAGRGSRQTVPTLNLAPETEVLPARGVYVTAALDPDSGRRWPAVTNLGVRPTFGPNEAVSVETYLLRPLQGPDPERLSLAFYHRLREERKFAGAAELRAQILRDVERSETFFRRLEAAQLNKEKVS